MYEMSKMTLEQEEVRNQEYNEYVEQMTPKQDALGYNLPFFLAI